MSGLSVQIEHWSPKHYQYGPAAVMAASGTLDNERERNGGQKVRVESSRKPA
jgi:hypothetical protein